MDSLFGRQKILPRMKGRAGGKSAFVTILDAGSFPRRPAPAPGLEKPGPARRAELRDRPRPVAGLKSMFRRGAVRTGSELGEKAQVAARLASGTISAVPGKLLRMSVSVRDSFKPGDAALAVENFFTEPEWLSALDGLPGRLESAARTAWRFFASSPRRIAAASLTALTIVALAAVVSQLSSSLAFPMPSGGILPDEGSAQDMLMAVIAPQAEAGNDILPSSLPPLPVMLQLRSYTVSSRDSLASVAKRFGIRQDTVISLNGLKSSQSFRSGVTLRIPNMDGVSHTVRSGDSLKGLAKRYGVEVTKIADANNLDTASLKVGQNLFIPGAKLSSSTISNFYGARVIWPLRGRISSPFGYRSNPFSGARTFHSAVDIVARRGTPVKAAMDGRVADAGYNSVFGKYVILSHSDGYQTLYAHLDEIYVRAGQNVNQSVSLGKSGNTGQSTGPHLHFSLFRNGKALDPMKYMK